MKLTLLKGWDGKAMTLPLTKALDEPEAGREVRELEGVYLEAGVVRFKTRVPLNATQ